MIISMAKVGKCVSPLQCFKISTPILFFRKKTIQPNCLKFLQNILQTDFHLKNKVWREVYNVATGNTHFPTLAIDMIKT